MHTVSSTQVTYAEDLPQMASEFIEPYAQRFMMMQLESVAYGLISPAEAKEYLKGADYFITTFSGLHAQIAVSNEYRRLRMMDDDTLLQIAKHTFEV